MFFLFTKVYVKFFGNTQNLSLWRVMDWSVAVSTGNASESGFYLLFVFWALDGWSEADV